MPLTGWQDKANGLHMCWPRTEGSFLQGLILLSCPAETISSLPEPQDDVKFTDYHHGYSCMP